MSCRTAVLARSAWLRMLVIGALVVSAYVFVPSVSPQLLSRAEAEPVSGAFALGGGLGGSVDPRTGQFSVSMPLVNVPSRGSSGVTMTLNWDQSRAGAGVDRYGWGAGWSLGTTFVSPQDGITVYPANGGAYAADGDFDSGLKNYVLRDMTFAIVDASPTACGDASPDIGYLLRYDDGRTDCFDDDGNFVARVDRFGNRTILRYTQLAPGQWQPAAIVDAYGLTTTFSYGDDDEGNPTVTVSAPKRADGVVASTVVDFDDRNRVHTVTDPLGSVAQFGYQSVPTGNAQYLSNVTGPSLAETVVTYQQISYPGAAPLLAVDTLAVEDDDGNQLLPTRSFSMNPAENAQRHNYVGYPDHLSTTEDLLFASADPRYQYTTEISNGQTSTLSTFDSAHRLISRQINAGTDDGDVVLQQQVLTYPGFAPPQALPPNYARPRTSSVSYWSSSGPGGLVSAVSRRPRTVSTATQYDDHGRIRSATDETGTVTLTSYDDAFGLVTSSVATGRDGSQRSVTNVLSEDRKTIKSTSQAEANNGAALSARTVTTYAYDGFGSPTSRTMAWADGAAPPDNGGGPAATTTTYASSVDAAARTRTVVVTVGAGTPAARPVTTTLDLVSGQTLRIVDALGRVTTRAYDAGGRIVTETPPTGLLIKTVYRAADGDDPATRTVTEADGHVMVTSYDPLGHATTVTDNVRNGAFVSDPTVRTVGTTSLSPDGTTLTATDRAGRTTITTNDPLGRPVQQVGPTGITKKTTYNDVTNTVGTAIIGDSAAGPSQTTSVSYDALNRELSSRTTYPVPNSSRPLFLVDPLMQTSYDGIGRRSSMTAGDLTAVPDYAGPGGTPVDTVVGPAETARAPGSPITAADTTMITGDPTLRTLQQSGQPARPGSKVTYDAAGNLTSITDGLGKITNYTYTADGRPQTRTTPTGTVTTTIYDPKTGRVATVTSKAANGNSTTTSYSYVPAGAAGAGLVKTLTNESGTLTYSYDADRNPVGIRYPDGTTISSDFADNGELLTSTDATGAVTTYAYYDDSTLRSAVQKRAGVTLASVSYVYDGLGRIQSSSRGNGLTTRNTYTPNNLLDTQVTTDKTGKQVEAYDYDYDSHHDLVREIATSAPLGSCRTACSANPTTAGTFTTSYRYDAYDRLIGSAVYAGAAATGTPVTKIDYALDPSGNVSATTRTTTTGGQSSTSVTNDDVDASGQLTSRTVVAGANQTTTKQTFDEDGRLQTSFGGVSTTYRPDGLPASVIKGGATTTYSYWADGSRRSATTTAPGTTPSSVTLYYRADGTLVNDTATQGGTQDTSATASYLLTAGREARTLRSGSTVLTTGTGVGYYLRDRHNSVTAVVDSTGTVTNTYAYADYGDPALLDGRPGRVTGAAAGSGVGRANPFTYTGAAVKGMYTDLALGTMMTPARVYDPAQGRFTSRDTANVHNRYVAFDTNPIMKVDPSGQSPIVDFFVDLLFTVVFLVATVETAGAAAAVGAEAYAALEAGEAAAEGLATAQLAQGVASVANVVGAVSYGTRLADDVGGGLTGKHFLTDDQRDDLNNVGTLAGGIAGVSGLVAAGANGAATAVEAATDAEASSAAPTEQAAESVTERPDTKIVDDAADPDDNDGLDESRRFDDAGSGDDVDWSDVTNESADGSSADDEVGHDDLGSPARPSAAHGAQWTTTRIILGDYGTYDVAQAWGNAFDVPGPRESTELGFGSSLDQQAEPALDFDPPLSRIARRTKAFSIEDLTPDKEGSDSLLTKDSAAGLRSARRADGPRDFIVADLSPVRNK